MTHKFNRTLQDNQYSEELYKLYEYNDKQDLSRWEWAKKVLIRYSRSYSISVMIIPVTELQFII